MRPALMLALWSLSLFAAGAPLASSRLAPPVADVRALLRSGDVDAAVSAGNKAVETLAQDAQAWFWAGRAYAQQALRANMLAKPKWAGRTRDAYEKAVALDPDHLEARFDLLQYYLAAPGFLGGGRDKAESQVAEMARRDPAWGQLGTAVLHLQDKRTDQAERAMRQGLAQAPDHVRLRIALAGLLQNQERWDDVRAVWNEQLGRDPEHAMAHYQLGRAAAITGEALAEGLAHMDAYLAAGVIPEELSPGAAHWRRGQILAKLGRDAEARTELQRALTDDTVATLARADLDRLGKGG